MVRTLKLVRCRDCHRVFLLTYTYEARIKRLARKTICFSRSVELHEKVIGTFIEKYMFY